MTARVRLLLLIVVCGTIFGVTAGPATSQDDAFGFDQTTGTVTDYRGVESHVVIPESIGGVAVLAIGPRAFMDSRSLESVVIPATVTTIGGGAFAGCENLARVTLPSSVTQIGARAFADCENLVQITLPTGLTSLGSGAFWGCSSLVSIAISEGLWHLGTATFWGCSSLTSVTLPQGLRRLPNGIFAQCESLTHITIPGSVKEIGYRAFADCVSLTTIAIPEKVVALSSAAFRGCTNLQTIAIADTNPVYATFDGVVYNRQRTKLIVYPPGLPAQHYAVPEGVRSIAAGAFWGCHNLASVTIPQSVTGIGGRAFEACPDLLVSTPENSYTHRYADRLGIQVQVSAPAATEAAKPDPLSEAQLRSRQSTNQSKLDAFLGSMPDLGSMPLLFTDDIREFAHYNTNDDFRDLVEHLLSLGYGIRQIEGYYDLYVGERIRYRGEPFTPERYSDDLLLRSVDGYQTDLDVALFADTSHEFPEDITDLLRYQTNEGFRERVDYLFAIGYGFQRIGRRYELYVGEPRPVVDEEPGSEEVADDAPTVPVEQLTMNDRVEVKAVGGLNLRSHPSLGADVVWLMPYRTRLTITGEPTVADGYTWWPVRSFTESGYVVEDHINRINTDLEVLLDVPHIHQSLDTGFEVWSPKWNRHYEFEGAHACGSTAAVMIAAFHESLGNDFAELGRYVNQAYTTPLGTEMAWVTQHYNPAKDSEWRRRMVGAGAWGFINRTTISGPEEHTQFEDSLVYVEHSGANKHRVVRFFEHHGLSAEIMSSPSAQDVKAQIDAGYPVYASTLLWPDGHIVVIRGYVDDGSDDIDFIVNDPGGNLHAYGDRHNSHVGSEVRVSWSRLHTSGRHIITVRPGNREEERSPDVSQEEFFELVTSGGPEEVQTAIDAGADVNGEYEGFTPLIAAAWRNQNPDVITTLIHAGAKVDAVIEGFLTPVVAAAANPNLEVLRVLLQRGAEVPPQALWGLIGSVAEGIMDLADLEPRFSFLIEAGADVNYRVQGISLLLRTLEYEQPELLQILLDAGADLEERFEFRAGHRKEIGTPLLMLACS